MIRSSLASVVAAMLLSTVPLAAQSVAVFYRDVEIRSITAIPAEYSAK